MTLAYYVSQDLLELTDVDRINKINKQKPVIGECVHVITQQGHEIYIITKKHFSYKPSYKITENCLSDLLWLC